jgi:hypothetical protein
VDGGDRGEPVRCGQDEPDEDDDGADQVDPEQDAGAPRGLEDVTGRVAE